MKGIDRVNDITVLEFGDNVAYAVIEDKPAMRRTFMDVSSPDVFRNFKGNWEATWRALNNDPWAYYTNTGQRISFPQKGIVNLIIND